MCEVPYSWAGFPAPAPALTPVRVRVRVEGRQVCMVLGTKNDLKF